MAEYSTALATTPQVSYLTTDHLGSPRVVTDKNGTVNDRKDYSAFGEESTSAERSSNTEYTAADQLRKSYAGYEKDGESGLEFAQARYYNPTHGRFTSVDPLTASASLRNPQTFNRYSYVLNSPYKFTDPLGLSPNLSDLKNKVIDAINGKGTLTEDELALAKFHIQNGTALGNAFLNASYAAIEGQSSPLASAEAKLRQPASLSANGRNLLKDYEGTVNSFYNDSRGYCTAGTGHLIAQTPCSKTSLNLEFTGDPGVWRLVKNIAGISITNELSERWLSEDIANAENTVRSNISANLTQEQFDALVILTFNYPISSRSTPKLIKAINANSNDQVKISAQWKDILGEPNLKYRRNDELELYFSGDYKREWKTTYYARRRK